METRKVRWGVISCAGIAEKSFLPALAKANNGVLYALSSRSQEKLDLFAKRFCPVKTYLTYEALLDDPAIDAVYIPLPNGLHKEWVIKAAQKKKHILCEKPMGINAREITEMRQACQENQVLLMEAFAYLHSPLTNKTKELLDAGVIGQLRSIEANFSFPLSDLSNVRLNKYLAGGATYDIGCYNISIIRFLAGKEPQTIKVMGDLGKDSGVDISAVSVFDFGNGLKAFSYCSFDAANRSSWAVLGTDGILEVPHQFNSKGNLSIRIIKEGKTRLIKVKTPDNYTLEVEQFSRCVLGKEKPWISLDFSLGNAKIIEETLKQIQHN